MSERKRETFITYFEVELKKTIALRNLRKLQGRSGDVHALQITIDNYQDRLDHLKAQQAGKAKA